MLAVVTVTVTATVTETDTVRATVTETVKKILVTPSNLPLLWSAGEYITLIYDGFCPHSDSSHNEMTWLVSIYINISDMLV